MDQQQSPSELWEEFEKTMLKAFPFLPKNFTHTGIADSSWLSDVVQKTVNQYLEQEMKSKFPYSVFGRSIGYDLFETHRSVILRLRLPEGMNPREPELSISSHRVRIKLPSGEKQVIPLPRAVSPQRARTTFRNGILELRLPKTREPYYPVQVDG